MLFQHHAPDSDTSSPGNFTVRRPYRPKKSDMPDSFITPIFAADGNEIG